MRDVDKTEPTDSEILNVCKKYYNYIQTHSERLLENFNRRELDIIDKMCKFVCNKYKYHLPQHLNKQQTKYLQVFYPQLFFNVNNK